MMKSKFKYLSIVIISVIMLFGLVGCSSSKTTVNTVTQPKFNQSFFNCELGIINSNNTTGKDETTTITSFENTNMKNPDGTPNRANCITFMTWLDPQINANTNSTNLNYLNNVYTAADYFANDTSNATLDTSMATDITTLSNQLATLNAPPVASTPVTPTIGMTSQQVLNSIWG